MEKATLGGGCFWCTEAIFQRLKGVERVTSGYSGGRGPAYYEIVSGGDTGYAEAIQIEFDPKVIPYKTILDVFFHLHDPTTLNRQGADLGTQYRSVIFYHTAAQKKTAEQVKEEVEKSGEYKDPVTTEIVKLEKFTPAEGYHQNYYNNNSEAAYCRIVIDPKITKLYKNYKELVKE